MPTWSTSGTWASLWSLRSLARPLVGSTHACMAPPFKLQEHTGEGHWGPFMPTPAKPCLGAANAVLPCPVDTYALQCWSFQQSA